MLDKLVRINGFVKCLILRRINRFIVEVLVDETVRKAHINNTGRLLEFLIKGREAYCKGLKRPKKTEFRLFSIKDKGLGVIIDPQLQMDSFENALSRGLIPWLRESWILKRNPRLGGSVLDYLINRRGENLYVEVKSAVLRGGELGNLAMYPDCPTPRGRRQIEELIRYVNDGGLGMLIFIAALPRAEAFKPNMHADNKLYQLLRTAQDTGVEIKALGIHFNPYDGYVYLSNPSLKILF